MGQKSYSPEHSYPSLSVANLPNAELLRNTGSWEILGSALKALETSMEVDREDRARFLQPEVTSLLGLSFVVGKTSVTLHEFVGVGAEGIVFKASQMGGGLPVAVKFYLPFEVNDPENFPLCPISNDSCGRAFQNEVAALSALKKAAIKNVQSLVGFGLTTLPNSRNVAGALVTEFIPGSSVEAFFKTLTLKGSELGIIAEIHRDLVDTLIGIAETKVTHQDLTWDNFIVEHNNGFRPKVTITDFGASMRDASLDSVATAREMVGMLTGSLEGIPFHGSPLTRSQKTCLNAIGNVLRWIAREEIDFPEAKAELQRISDKFRAV